MKKIFLLFLLLSSFLYSKDIDKMVAQIRKDFSETNNYKKYHVEAETLDLAEGVEIKRYYKNQDLRKVTTEGFTSGLKKYSEYYIKNGKTYFKYVEVTELYNNDKNAVSIFRYYYDNHENLIRYIDNKGKIFENELELLEEDDESSPWHE